MSLARGRRYRMTLEYVRFNPETGLHIFNVVGAGAQIELDSIY